MPIDGKIIEKRQTELRSVTIYDMEKSIGEPDVKATAAEDAGHLYIRSYYRYIRPRMVAQGSKTTSWFNLTFYGFIVFLSHFLKLQKYGNVFTFWLGPVPTVHIADYETARDAMITNGSTHIGRFTPYILDVLREGRGTVFSEGEFWQEHRRFNLRTLRHFGLGRNIMEERIMDEFELNEDAMIYDVVKKIREELLSVTKGNRSISLSDKSATTYLNWTILVILIVHIRHSTD
uniref:Cytochrome P450 n=1 Tax=Heterorhabditis bacteriophora TaxID=37862 RepID=A0A1I7W7M1_HETBA